MNKVKLKNIYFSANDIHNNKPRIALDYDNNGKNKNIDAEVVYNIHPDDIEKINNIDSSMGTNVTYGFIRDIEKYIQNVDRKIKIIQ